MAFCLCRCTVFSSFLWTICATFPVRTSNKLARQAFVNLPTVLSAPVPYFCSPAQKFLFSHSNFDKASITHRKSSCQPPMAQMPNLAFVLRMSSSATEDQILEDEIDPGQIEGTTLKILKYPHPQLRAEDKEITEFDESLKQVVKEMFMVMYACHGVGLAAPQVGINKRLMVFNPEGDPKKWLKEVALVNPRIVESSESMDVEVEGCLSFPKMQGSVRRHKWIKVEAFDVKGKKIKKKYEGWEARVFQHEYDHLDGKLYIDRLEPEDRVKVQPVLDSLVAAHREALPDLEPAL